MMLHTALTVWRLSLPDCLQFPQATVPHPMPHLPSMQHAPCVPVNIPSLPLETGHWTLPPMMAVPCASSPKVHTALGSLPIISWHSACPLGWLLALLKRKQATAWDLVLTSCLWPADWLAATMGSGPDQLLVACRPVGPVRPL
jgi:hypothetical protein